MNQKIHNSLLYDSGYFLFMSSMCLASHTLSFTRGCGYAMKRANGSLGHDEGPGCSKRIKPHQSPQKSDTGSESESESESESGPESESELGSEVEQQVQTITVEYKRANKTAQKAFNRLVTLANEEKLLATQRGKEWQSTAQQLTRTNQQLIETEQRLEETEQRLEETEQRLEETEQRLQQTEQRLEETEQRLQQTEQRLEETEQQLQETEQQLQQSDQRADQQQELAATAERRLQYSDQVFQDVLQRLIGQLPQSQPSWVVQRNEIELLEEIGSGGWAMVKVAKFRGNRVAAKCLHRQIVSAHNVRVFTREMNMAANARHPNLLQFIGATLDNEEPIILTELMSTSLCHLLEGGTQLTHAQIVSVSRQVALALNYLHLMQPEAVIHRDVSSANVLLDLHQDSWIAKLSDYGSANFVRHTTTAGPGNPTYAAPEANNPDQQSAKMDVFSFGVLLVEMCSGELAPAEHRDRLLGGIQWPNMVALIRHCLRHEPQRRPDMNTVLTQLDQL